MKNYTLIDHTADFGIQIKGKDYKELFTRAAVAMFDVVAQIGHKIKPSEKKEIRVELEAENADDLLLCWLSELISISDAKNLIFKDFKILKLTEKSLSAKASGAQRKHFIIEREIKAVTYHQLKIKREGRRYKVEIIFDV